MRVVYALIAYLIVCKMISKALSIPYWPFVAFMTLAFIITPLTFVFSGLYLK